MPGKWCVLIHQIPPRPLYLRAKVRQQLVKVGAVALKNSVYVLPSSDEAVEDFQWVAEQITAGGGEAYLCVADFVAGISGKELMARFRAGRLREYEALRDQMRSARAPTAAARVRFRERFAEIRKLDFFPGPIGKEIENMIQKLEKRAVSPKRRRSGPAGKMSGRTWVTRRGVKIDRIASAWLVRRMIDRSARFRFVDPDKWKKSSGELAFDIAGGDYTHQGERCTFETILTSFGLKERALRQIAEIVHDIDLKDGKFGRADAAGIKQVLEGILTAYPVDERRLERGFALFDDLYSSFQR